MGKKLTKEEFILKAIGIHGDRYDYSLVDYIGMKNNIKIKCYIHGEFEQTPDNHLQGKGCMICGGRNALTTKTFIEKSKKIHGEKYDYSLVNYMNYETKVKIKCFIHGEFEQTPSNHLQGYDCYFCYGNQNLSSYEFIEKAILIHNNKYNYSKINYINTKLKIDIICPVHGDYKQTPNKHLNGSGCPKCVGKFKTTNDYINEVKKVHNNKYDYSLVNYINSISKIKIICPVHGEFEQKSNIHLRGNGCSKCSLSKGEIKIEEYLRLNNFIFFVQKRFKNCKNKNSLPFDFYLPDHNICIEYDGEQHYKSINYFGGDNSFNNTKLNDAIKTKYCLDNNIKLIRIPYTEKDIERYLMEEIKKVLV